MKVSLFVIIALGFSGLVWSCGGTSEAPVKKTTPSIVNTPEQQSDAAPEVPVDATRKDAGAEINDNSPEGSPTTSEQEPIPDKPAETATTSQFKGKGMKTSVIGTNKGRRGPTNFDHWKHQEQGTRCIKCHHKGAGRKSCNKGSDCHKFTEKMAPTTKDAYHKSCNPCHRSKGLPKSCDYCHAEKPS